MPRAKGSGALGPVRSLRLPHALDRWFEERLRDDPSVPASELLLRLVHGGLRLKPGYMLRHKIQLERLRCDTALREAYSAALCDSFGEAYLRHIYAWIETESVETVDKNAR